MSDYHHHHSSRISALSRPSPILPYRQADKQKRGPSPRRGFCEFYRSCDQVLVGEAATERRAEQAGEAVKRVAADITVTEPKGELADIAVQVLRRGVVIDAVNAALENREHALDAVRGDIAPDILASAVIDALVLVEQPADAVVDRALVCVDRRAYLNVPIDKSDRVPPADRRLHFRLYSSGFARPTGDDRHLADATPAKAEPLVLVLRGLFPADVAFVDFDYASQFGGVVATSFAETPEHKPRGLLCDAYLLSQLKAADALSARDQQIHGVEPLVQRHLRALKYRSGANGEDNQIGVAAIKSGPLRIRPDALALAAGWAARTFRPALPLKVEAGGFVVGEALEQIEGADCGLAHGSARHDRA